MLLISGLTWEDVYKEIKLDKFGVLKHRIAEQGLAEG